MVLVPFRVLLFALDSLLEFLDVIIAAPLVFLHADHVDLRLALERLLEVLVTRLDLMLLEFADEVGLLLLHLSRQLHLSLVQLVMQ